MTNGGKPGVQNPNVGPAWLKKLWNDHPLVVVAGVTVIALALAVALIWPITDLIAAHDVGLITGSKREAALQTAGEAVRTQLLTLGAGVFAAGALIFTARNFTLSRTTFRATEVRVLNERFATAAGQLGGDKPSAVRLAGVYAMAGLADDWKANRQTCVDVLCAYLRLCHEQEPGKGEKATAFQDDREVRHTVIRVITAHLQKDDDAAVSWQGLDFDFTGAVFDGGDFHGAQFSGGTVSFHGAQFSGGTVSFHGAQFSGGTVSFHGAQFTGGTVDFGGAQFSGGRVLFGSPQFPATAQFTGGTVSFDRAQFTGGRVWFDGVQFTRGTVSFDGAEFTGGTVSFDVAEFTGGTVRFGGGAQFSGGEVSFDFARFLPGGTVSFGARFLPGGTVRFDGAEFSGGEVSFGLAGFYGGTVDFSNANALKCSHPPTFDWKGPPPAGVKLSAGIGGESQ